MFLILVLLGDFLDLPRSVAFIPGYCMLRRYQQSRSVVSRSMAFSLLALSHLC